MNIEDILKQISFGIQSEKDSFSEMIKARTEIIKQYIASLQDAQALVSEVSRSIKNDVEAHLETKKQLSDAISSLRATHASEIATHDVNLKEKNDHHERLSIEIATKDKLKTSIDNNIQGLILERDAIENSIMVSRSEEATLNRTVSSLKSEKAVLDKSISDKRAEESSVLASIEGAKKQFSALTSDIAILEKRKQSL